MYILNLTTGTIQECRNQDVIKICRKHLDEYQLSEKRENLKVPEQKKKEEKERELSDMKVEELREIAAEKGIEGYGSLNKKELCEVLRDVMKDDES